MKNLLYLFERDMDKLLQEIEAIDDDNLWTISGDIKNSIGNLAIHLCGNLQHFIGHVLSNTGYERDRVKEFRAKNLEKSYILTELKATKKVLQDVLPTLSEETLAQDFPINVFGDPLPTIQFIYHLYGHLNYHLGQINYRRRLLR